MPGSSDNDRHKSHESHLSRLDADVGELKTEVSKLQTGQENLQASQNQGFARIEAALVAKSSEPPKIGVALLLTLLGFILTGLAAFAAGLWLVMQLTFTPLKEEVAAGQRAEENHWQFHRHENAGGRLSLLEERTEINREEIEDLERWREMINEERVLHAREMGRLDTLRLWLRDDDEAQKEDLQRHIESNEY